MCKQQNQFAKNKLQKPVWLEYDQRHRTNTYRVGGSTLGRVLAHHNDVSCP